jgi:hypothetical protein
VATEHAGSKLQRRVLLLLPKLGVSDSIRACCRRTENLRLKRYNQASLHKRQREYGAATTIQAAWRGHQVRLHIFGKKHAARIIQVQASARVMLTLKRVRRMKEESHAAAIIQRHWRGILVRKRFAQLLARYKLCLPRAIKIQVTTPLTTALEAAD